MLVEWVKNAQIICCCLRIGGRCLSGTKFAVVFFFIVKSPTVGIQKLLTYVSENFSTTHYNIIVIIVRISKFHYRTGRRPNSFRAYEDD